MLPTCYVKMDLVVVLDESGSMRPYAADAVSLTESLIPQFAMADSWTRMGVIEFNHRARVTAPFTTDSETVQRGLASYRPGGGTGISEGLKAAERLLSTTNRSDALQVILLFTDGVQSSYLGGDRVAITSGQQVRMRTGCLLYTSPSPRDS